MVLTIEDEQLVHVYCEITELVMTGVELHVSLLFLNSASSNLSFRCVSHPCLGCQFSS